MLYRIFTEDKPDTEAIVSAFYDGYTVYRQEGYWKGIKEDSLLIEIITEKFDRDRINALAETIKEINGQEVVLVQEIENNQWIV